MPGFYVSHNELTMIGHMNRYVEAAEARTWPEAKHIIPDADTAEQRNAIGQIWNLFADSSIPALTMVMERHYQVITERRMAATALAIRLYELDHGQRPKTLEELVPDYLPAVPDDPYSAGPQPIRYLPDADPPILYSVGENGEDDGGEFAVDDEGGLYGGDPFESPDVPFFLNGAPPQEPVSWKYDTPALQDDERRHRPGGPW
jgi:hypothetical protein